jgi:3'(2'), 5'-bisphosphate nucleotidase
MPVSPRSQAIAKEMPQLLAICEKAHQAILPFWQSKSLEVSQKGDDSPVTQADKAANAVIVEALRELTPDILIISEEEKHQPPPPHNEPFWLVDPLDGTKSFIRGSDQFTVNIALIEHNTPIIGVLGVPAQNLRYHAIKGDRAFKIIGNGTAETLQVSHYQKSQLNIVSSLSHRSPKLDTWLEAQEITIQSRLNAGSALKFALVAEGSADLYPRFGPTMEWDTAAGHCLIEAAGGSMTQLDGTVFNYGKPGYLNGGFLASGKIEGSPMTFPQDLLSH